MSIAYTPIDLKFDKVDYPTLLDYVKTNFITNLGYTSKLAPVATRYEVNDWTDCKEVFDKDNGYELKEDYDIFFAPGIKELFPSIVDLIYRLPYKQLIGAGFNLHENTLYPHRDDVDTNLPYTPERYNVLLSPHYELDSFFVCENIDSKKVYPTILEDYPVYAFDNRNYYHGADPVLDDRIILVCVGIIDEHKHKQLIDSSVEKFKDYIIRF